MWVTKLKAELSTTAEDAREAVRDWAAKRIGYQRSRIQRLLDWIFDWADRARVEASAWERQRAADNKAAIDEHTAFLDQELKKYASLGEEQAKREIAKLDEEHLAIVDAFFTSRGGYAEARIAAVAAGLITRISIQRRPELAKKIEDIVIASTDTDQVLKVAEAESPGFTETAKIKSNELREAFAGPGTTEEKVSATLSGMTRLQSHALELMYEKRFGKNLRKRLDAELNDWATWSSHDIDRAKALLAGETETADAIALDRAMYGGWLGWGVGTDRQAMEEVYASQDQDLEEADEKGWDSAKLNAERARRRAKLSAGYEARYGWRFKDRKPGQAALDLAFHDDMSGADLNLIQGLH